jgi:dienelactone hydrolase
MRFVAISRELARSGVRVLTPDFPELRRLEIAPELTSEIEQAALWLAIDSGLARHKRIGLMGVSLSGGLTVVAAGRPSLRNHVSYVFALGGYDDLPRVVRYLVSGEIPQPPGRRPAGPELRQPHDYGQAVILLAIADRLVPPEQVPALTTAVRRFLDASYEERIDQERASDAMQALWRTAQTLPEPAAGLLRDVLSRDVTRLGPRLQPYVGPFGQSNALSPARSPSPSAPVFLLHGVGDRLVPTEESESLAGRLRATTPVHLLTTSAIAHAEVDRRASAADVFRLARFWGNARSVAFASGTTDEPQ